MGDESIINYMNYLYIFLPVIVWVVSQTFKFFIRLREQGFPKKLKTLFWVYMWAGGAPSTHTAVLVSSLVLVWNDFGFSALFTFCFAVTGLLVYNMISERKRQEVMNNYFKKDDDLKKSIRDGYLLDLAGHTLTEIVWGALLGLVLGFTAVQLIS